MKNPNMLKSALYNLHPGSAKHEYAQGLLVGVVSTLMAEGMEFQDAMTLAVQHMPKEVMIGAIPAAWHSAFGIAWDRIREKDNDRRQQTEKEERIER